MKVLCVAAESEAIQIQQSLARTLPDCMIDATDTLETVHERLDSQTRYDAVLWDGALSGADLTFLSELLLDRGQRPFPIIYLANPGSEIEAAQVYQSGLADYRVKHSAYLLELPIALENALRLQHLREETAVLRDHEAQLRQKSAGLHRYEQDAALALDHASDLIVRFDRELRHLYVNQAVTSVSGIPRDNYLGKTNEELGMAPAQVDFWNQELRRVLANAQPHNFSFQFSAVDGRVHSYEAVITPELDSAGQVASLLSIVRDISDRVAAEQQIRLQSLALNAAANGIAITDVEGIIQWVNPAFVNLTGYSFAEAVGRNPRELLKSGRHDRALYQHLWATILAGRVWHGEMINQRKDGSLYDEEQTITPLRHENGEITHFVAIKQDITARRQNERAAYLLQTLPNAIADAPSLESGLETALSLVCHLAGWELGELWVPTHSGELSNPAYLTMFMHYYQDPGSDADFRAFREHAHFAQGEGLPGLVWSAHDVVWIPEIAQDTNFVHADLSVPLGFHVAMGLPIVVDGAVTAVMCFFSKSQRQKEDYLVSLMSSVAVQLAAAFQRKQYQERLLLSQQLSQTTIDALSAHIAVLDENGAIIAVNKPWLNFAQTYGADLSRVGVGVNYLDVCATAQGEPGAIQMLASIRAVMDGTQSEFTLEYQCPTPDDLKWFACRVMPLPGRAANQRGVVISHENITARKQAELERAANAQRLQQILDTMPDGVLLLDETGQIQLVNPRGQQLLQAVCDCQVGDQLLEVNGHSLKEIIEITNHHGSHTFQRGKRYFDLLVQPLTLETSANGWILVLRDITAEHERQKYLEMQNRLATVGQLAAGIAHDFNNVMAVIVLYTQLLQAMEGISQRGQHYLETIIKQAYHAARIISQILDFSRRSVMERSSLDLLPMLKELVRLLKNTLPERITIELLYEPGEYTILGDLTRLQQAVMNLALNARDAMPQGGELRFSLDSVDIPTTDHAPLPDMAAGYWLRLTISDTGTGIQPDHLPHIFEPFFTTKEVGKGAGLGLAQLHGIIKQHEGAVSVESVLGTGTTFALYLPLLKSPAQPAREAEKSDLAITGAETILLVEDNETIRESIAEALLSLGYQVLQAGNGVEALDLLTKHLPAVDLLLSDLMMPQMDGVSLYQAVRNRFPALKTLFMSGYRPQEKEAKVMAGASWINKPFTREELGRAVRTLLDR